MNQKRLKNGHSSTKARHVRRSMIGRLIALILAVNLALSLSGYVPPQTSQSQSGQLALAATKAQKYQPKHLLADAVKRLNGSSSGSLQKAAQNDSETDAFYEALSDDEKKLYEAYCVIFTAFDPYQSSNDFHNQATSGGSLDTVFADELKTGKVAKLEFSRSYTNEERVEMYNTVSLAYVADHPYNLAIYIYAIPKRIKGNKLYLALSKCSQVEQFDVTKWGSDLVQFEEKALEEIISDGGFSEANNSSKVYLVHEYICKHVVYDYSKPSPRTIPFFKDKSAYGPMVEYKGVCIGIALMAKILLDDLGVQSFILVLDKHAWNMVLLYGDYYELDATWDLARKGNISYKYFDVTSDEIQKLDTSGMHVRDRLSSKLPVANGTKYNYEYVCSMLGVPADENPDEDPDPDWRDDDYITDDDTGETYPNAEEFEYNGLYYDLSSDGYASVVGVKGNPKTVTIPSCVVLEYDDEEYEYLITDISSRAFYNYDKLKTVTIGEFVCTIGEGAFYKCKKLKKIHFLDHEWLYDVGSKAFGSIHKNAVLYMKTDATTFKRLKKLIKKSGIPKKAKIKNNK